MDKKTILRYILAIVLSAALVFTFWIVQSLIIKSTPVTQTQSKQKESNETSNKDNVTQKSESSLITAIEAKKLIAEDKNVSTKNYDIVFSTKGGVIKSLKLKEFKESSGSPIEIVVSGGTGIYSFGIKFGEYNSENDIFEYSRNESDNSYEFKRSYKLVGEDKKEYIVTLNKKYIFKEDYLIDFIVSIECPDSKYIPLDFQDSMYVLNFGPQIGPGYDTQLSSNEFRRYTYFDTERRDMTNDVTGKRKIINKLIRWAAIEGKYFIVISYPPKDFIDKQVGFDETPIEGLSKHSSMFFNRPFEKIASVEDHFKFYIGPKKKEILDTYAKYDFDKAIANDFFFGWLNYILKVILEQFYKLTNNWGIAIIILTVLIKVVFFPITQKGLKASMKMQGLAPKLEEIRTRYKDNPQKQQAETAELYKREGINPLTGCLPLLIQLPFFYALYQLLSNQFDLRGAVFIQGWINDLSSPEFIFTLPFSIPFITNKIRLLPFLVLATQFIQQKLSPTSAGSGSPGQMKLLLYGLPIIFFFIMYPLPSGLSLYWTVQNLLSILNQIYNNIVLKRPTANIELYKKNK